VNEVLNPPTTNTKHVDVHGRRTWIPSDTTSGLVTKSQLVKGTWLSTTRDRPATQVLVTTAYASQKG
jgi:hypothetical protein